MSDVTDILLAEIAENIKSLAGVSPLSAGAVLDLLKTVDGSGSGLDADTVCGVSAVNRDWTNSSGLIIPAIGLTKPLLWYTNNNWYIVAGADFVLGRWEYNSTNQAIVINSYTGGRVQFRSANLAGHVAGDSITWTVDTYVSLETHVHGDYQPLDDDLTAIAALTGTTGLLKKTAANTWALDAMGKNNLTLSTGIVASPTVVVMSIGDMGLINGQCMATAAKSPGAIIGVISSGYRPHATVITPTVCYTGSTARIIPIEVQSGGNILIGGSLSINDYVEICVTYII